MELGWETSDRLGVDGMSLAVCCCFRSYENLHVSRSFVDSASGRTVEVFLEFDVILILPVLAEYTWE